MAALQAGGVAAAILIQPFDFAAERQGYRRIGNSTEAMPNFDRFTGTSTYITSEPLRHAVNVALALERPLLLRGEHSDLLLRSTAEEMARRGPHAELVKIPGCGRAKTLLADDQIADCTRH